MRSRLKWASLIVVTAWATNLPAQYYLAPYEPIYTDLIYLQNNGWLQTINLSQQPLTNEQLKTALYRDLQDGRLVPATDIQKQLLQHLVKTYFSDDTLLSRAAGLNGVASHRPHKVFEDISLGGRLDLNYYSNSLFDVPQAPGVDLERGFYPQLRTWGMLKVSPQLSLVNVMAVDPYATKNPRYVGKEWRGLSGYTEQAYFLYCHSFNNEQKRHLRLTGGRSYIISGPGRTGQLLISGAMRPMDNFRADLFLPYINFQSTFAKLDAIGGKARYLSLHRIGLQTKRLDLNLTEALLYGGQGRSPEWAYLNPLLLLHGENINGPALAGNTLGTIDLRYKGNHWQLYGELLIDDIQFDKKEVGDLEPNEIGGLLGIHLADPFKIPGLYVGAEVVALTNRTYKTVEPYEWYIHRNVPIGYAAGSDLARWNLLVRQYWSNWRLTGQLDYWWRGAGEMSQPWDSPWDTCTVAEGYHEKFPTGRVECINRISLQVEWFRSYNWYIFASLGYQMVHNKSHTSRKEAGLIVSGGFHWQLRQ